MKKITINLSDSGSLDKAISEIKSYRESLERKTKDLIDALLREGIVVANIRLASTVGDSKDARVDSVYVDSSGEVTKALIFLDGKDALFIEFGAGIAYNTGAQHPLASEFGYGPGTYPSEHPPNKGINPGRWIYGHTDDGKPLWSIGTGASMPIYGAAEHMRNVLIQKVSEIFRS